jgi:hypothetical protein
MMAYKLAATPFEQAELLERWPEFGTAENLESYLGERSLRITVWSAADVNADYDRVGLPGSPTKVLKADYVVLEGADFQEFEASQEGIAALVHELVQDYVV